MRGIYGWQTDTVGDGDFQSQTSFCDKMKVDQCCTSPTLLPS